jgi:DNA repair photolyase
MNSNGRNQGSRSRPPAAKRGAVSQPPGRFAREHRVPDQAALASVEDAWSDGVPPPSPATRVTDEPARRVITRNESPDVFFSCSINPYRGCEHGCVYCYARPYHAYMDLSPGLDFETRLFAKRNAADCLRRELAAPSYRCEPICIGTATDCYQPIERDLRITRGIIEVLAASRHPFSLITKSSLVERDLDLIAPAAADATAAVYVTVTCLDPGLARAWEPRAPAPWRRIETVRRLAEAGVPVGVMVAPIVPFLNDGDIEAVIEAAARAGARSAHFTVLRLPHELREVFTDWLRERFPDRAERVLARIRDLRGGRMNDPRFHDRMRGEGVWAELIARRFAMAVRRHGLSRDRVPLTAERFAPPAQAQPGGDGAQASLF